MASAICLNSMVSAQGIVVEGVMQVDGTAVQYYIPTERKSRLALILIPGGGLSSWSYATTPDGRDGWATLFAKAGIPVYLTNPPSGFREKLGRWNKELVWPLWGIGPEFGVPYEDSKFPHEHITALQASFHITPAPTADIGKLLDQSGPAVVLGHSAGGRATFGAARARHANLEGTIAVETTYCPTDEALLRPVYVDDGRRFLSLWGDNLDRGAPSMQARYETCQNASDIIAAAGGEALTIRLPEDLDIGGNSHLLMQDINSAAIAGLIIDWLSADASN